MIGFFWLGYEMQAWKKWFLRKVRVVVERLDNTTTGTLEDRKHERRGFEAPTNTRDVVDHVHVHVNGCCNRLGF